MPWVGGAWSGAVGQATGNILLQRPLRFWSKLNTFQIAHSYFRNRLSHYRRLGPPRKKKAVYGLGQSSPGQALTLPLRCPWSTADSPQTLSTVRLRGVSGHAVTERQCPLMTQSGHRA